MNSARNKSTIPNDSANSKDPLLVSNAIAVVIVLVNPSMLPPTIIAIPTSPIARPKPVMIPVISAKRVSLI